MVVIEGVSYKTSSNKLRKTKSSAVKRQGERKITSLSKTPKIGKCLCVAMLFISSHSRLPFLESSETYALFNKLLGKLSKTVTIKGEKFAMDSKGKTLQRVNTGMQSLSPHGLKLNEYLE